MKLVRLPDELVDYVILHELAHTIKRGHSKSFWAEMDKLVGNGKQVSSRLRSYGSYRRGRAVLWNIFLDEETKASKWQSYRLEGLKVGVEFSEPYELYKP